MPRRNRSNPKVVLANTNAEYFFNYYDNLSKVTQDDVKRIIEKYISGKKPLVSVLLNPEIYNSTKKDFESEGFYEVRSDEKRWWQEKQFELKEPVQNSNFKFTEEKNIYIPQENQSSKTENKISKRNIEIKKLKNKIPIYINNTSDKIISIAILCPGGVEKLTPETSGMETTLFSFMADSSKKF